MSDPWRDHPWHIRLWLRFTHRAYERRIARAYERGPGSPYPRERDAS